MLLKHYGYRIWLLVVLGFNTTLTAKVISWRSVTHVFPGFLIPVLTQLFFPKPPTTFLTCFCRGERRKYAGKKSCLNRGSNSQPPGHESDTLTTEPPGQGMCIGEKAPEFSPQYLYYVRDKSNYLSNLILIGCPQMVPIQSSLQFCHTIKGC